MASHVRTPYPEVNQLVQQLDEQIRAILGVHLVGLYLDGSLARGGFDSASDIDFVAVTEQGPLSEPHFLALQAMHERIAQGDARLATDIEGYYVSRAALRGIAPPSDRFANLERGAGERLKWVTLGQDWIIHRYILREYGLELRGPSLRSLIDPIPPDELRQAMSKILEEWGGDLLRDPEGLSHSAYQSYVVLSVCRILCTQETGDIFSKADAAAWAAATLEARWQPLIERAVRDRMGPYGEATQEAVAATLAFLAYAQGGGRAPDDGHTRHVDQAHGQGAIE